ncbi:ribonuclease H-like domain-containing protein [Tanacetum coccineum]
MNCHATTTSPIPRSHLHALYNSNWHKATVNEYNALISNGTWALVPRPANVKVVRSMWLYRHKYNADGSLSRYKAQLVANGHSQQQGIDCDETFSLVVKLATIHIVLSLAVTHNWPIHQLDHSLYGLKQAPQAWFHRFASFITRVGFQYSKTDTSLFVYHRVSDIAYLLLYMDDIVLTPLSTTLLQCIITLLHSEFAMTNLRSLNYFLGIFAQRSTSGLFLSQSKFVEEILERAHMQHCNPCRTPMDTESKLGSNDDPVSDPTLYHSLAASASSTAQLTTYTNADWARFLSSAEAEYRGIANFVAETAWLRNLLLKLHAPLTTATLVYCDNIMLLSVRFVFSMYHPGSSMQISSLKAF